MLLYLADFALQEQAEDNLTVAFLFGEHNGELFILLPYLNAISINLVSGYFAYIV